MLEPLEDRRLLAIVWANEFGANGFDIYGNDEVYARDLVNRAMDDWDRVITDFNYDGDANPNTTNARVAQTTCCLGDEVTRGFIAGVTNG